MVMCLLSGKFPGFDPLHASPLEVACCGSLVQAFGSRTGRSASSSLEQGDSSAYLVVQSAKTGAVRYGVECAMLIERTG